jgi:hypothetical protein
MLKLAKHLYTTYINAVGNKSVNGETLLDADKFFADPEFKVQSDAWKAVSKAARNYGEADEIVKISTKGAKSPLSDDESSNDVDDDAISLSDIVENEIMKELIPISIQLNNLSYKLIQRIL